MMALRGGTVAGEHTVYLFGEDEDTVHYAYGIQQTYFCSRCGECGDRLGRQRQRLVSAGTIYCFGKEGAIVPENYCVKEQAMTKKKENEKKDVSPSPIPGRHW